MRALLLLAIFPFALAACASAPTASQNRNAQVAGAERAAALAAKMVGTPYKYGGSSPSGFDCSGLVQYSFRNAGIALPHNTVQQRSATRLVKLAELRRGDLLFFNQEGKKYGHVAIYLGDGKFVHAPSSGKSVRSDLLSNPYWKKHLSEVRRPT